MVWAVTPWPIGASHLRAREETFAGVRSAPPGAGAATTAKKTSSVRSGRMMRVAMAFASSRVDRTGDRGRYQRRRRGVNVVGTSRLAVQPGEAQHVAA